MLLAGMSLRDGGRNLWWPSIGGVMELVIKLALAAVTPGVDLEALVQTQRAAAQRSMHDLTRLRRGGR